MAPCVRTLPSGQIITQQQQKPSWHSVQNSQEGAGDAVGGREDGLLHLQFLPVENEAVVARLLEGRLQLVEVKYMLPGLNS